VEVKRHRQECLCCYSGQFSQIGAELKKGFRADVTSPLKEGIIWEGDFSFRIPVSAENN
jgi:hypothetical protein